MPRRLTGLNAADLSRLLPFLSLAAAIPLEDVVHEALHTVVVHTLCLQLKQRRVCLRSVVLNTYRSLFIFRLCNRSGSLSRMRIVTEAFV